MTHDKDACPICIHFRVNRLRQRGVTTRLLRQLRAAGTAALPLVKVLETATPQQIAAANREATA